MIYLYCISVIVYFYLIFRCNLHLLSPFVIFGLFSFIYVFFPWLYLTSDVEIFLFDGDYLNIDSANTIILLQTITNLALCFIIPLPISQNVVLDIDSKESLINSNIKNFYWFIYPITLSLVYFFPWGDKNLEASLGHSLAAAFKNLLLFAFCFYCNKSSNVKMFFAFLSFLVLCIIDTSRTTLFVLIFLYTYYSKLSWKRLFKYVYLIIPIFFLFVWITLKRNDIDFENKYILWVFYTESLLGGYSTFQSISIVEKNIAPLFMFLYPIIDIFIYIVPSIFFSTFDLVKANCFITPNFFNSLFKSGLISEKYAPMGGHFYLAEFFLYFRFISPFFVFLYYSLFFKILKKIRYKEIALILYCSSFLLVKASIFDIFKFFLAIFVLAYLLFFLFKGIKILIKTDFK